MLSVLCGQKTCLGVAVYQQKQLTLHNEFKSSAATPSSVIAIYSIYPSILPLHCSECDAGCCQSHIIGGGDRHIIPWPSEEGRKGVSIDSDIDLNVYITLCDCLWPWASVVWCNWMEWVRTAHQLMLILYIANCNGIIMPGNVLHLYLAIGLGWL